MSEGHDQRKSRIFSRNPDIEFNTINKINNFKNEVKKFS